MTDHTTPEVRILTIRQPWAGLIAGGHKDVENRGWGTDYRGLIAIHAGKQPDVSATARELIALYTGEYFDYGTIVAVAELVDVTRDHPSNWAEPGQVHWVLDNVVPLDPPFRHTGQRGLQVLPPAIAASVLEHRGPRP